MKNLVNNWRRYEKFSYNYSWKILWLKILYFSTVKLHDAEITSALEVKQIYVTVNLNQLGTSGPERLNPNAVHS